MQETLLRLIEAAAARGLQFLLIGGNAVIVLGYIRNTMDIDLLVEEAKRSHWLDLVRSLGFRIENGTAAFAQFEPEIAGNPPLDLMFVNTETWQKLFAGSSMKTVSGCEVRIARPDHLVALKLHAASSPTRSKPELDWEDIRQIVRICKLDWRDPEFQKIILQYGGETALHRLQSFPP